ncbi:hypothetical protein DPMN_059099 [Dreissena polymorpha]|uniref:Uncharacterized protein n=1 Tax=Dreissena polymorpha TaxID=45954 RepID=A0A9D4C3C5_DREPO|nr:hypothetical protein DPMN_059099 [Dreissena polymorpha]
MGEELPFFAHLEAQRKSTRWLKLLEGIMKNTMATVLQACVQTRIEDGKCYMGFIDTRPSLKKWG